MFKIILMLLVCVQLMFAIDFKETRYLYAIDKSIDFEGSITFLKESIKITYIKPKQESIVYTQNDAIKQKKLFFMILEAIHSDDETLLGEFFEIKKDKNIVTLRPLELAKEYIKKVEYEKQKDRLIFIEIFMQNNDRIKIETIR
ncbi:MAG: hypothetical protein R3331_03990 [Sulfurospirillaceae bacterium]|nr:hypothetical protein [Sulfurospirillaceae bacterium]